MFSFLHFVSCVIDTTLFLFLLKYIVNAPVSLSIKTLIYTCSFAMIGTIIDTLTGGNIGIMSVILLFPLCLYMYCEIGTVLKRLGQYFFIVLLYFSLEIFSIFIELLLLGSLLGESDTNLRFLLVTIVLNTFTILGIWKVCETKKLRILFSIKEKILLLFINVITFMILTSIVHFNEQILIRDTKEQILIIILNYSVIFFYLFFVLFFVNGKVASHFKEIGRVSQEHMMEQLKYFSSYKQMQEETRRFRHDMKSHLLYLQVLSNEGKIDEMKNYIQSLADKWEDLPHLYTTGSDVIDTILNAKRFLFEENQISFDLSGSFTTELKLKPMLLITLLKPI